MAFTDNTTWIGKETTEFYSAILKMGDTKANIRIMPNVKSKALIPRLDFANLLQAGDCTYTDGGDTTLSQKTLEVVTLKVNKTFCESTFENNFLSQYLAAGDNNGEVTPQAFLTYAMDLMAKNVSSDLENIIWNGSTGSTSNPVSLANGFIKAFDADSDVVGLTAAGIGATSQVGLTAGNIIAALTAVYNAIPAALVGNPDLKIFMSKKDASYYKVAQASVATANGMYFLDDKPLTFLGIPIVSSAWINAGRIVLTHSNNLWMGTDLESDENTFKALYMYDVTGEPTLRIVMRFKFGINYGVGAEVVSAKFGSL